MLQYQYSITIIRSASQQAIIKYCIKTLGFEFQPTIIKIFYKNNCIWFLTGYNNNVLLKT